MLSTPLLSLLLLLVASSTATLDDVDEGSGILVDSSVIPGSAIMETDRQMTDPFLSSPPRTVHKVDNTIDEETSNNMPLISTLKNLSASLPFDMGPVMVEKQQAHNYATTVTEDSFSHRITIEQAGNMSIKVNPLANNTKIEKRIATPSNRENRSSNLTSDTLSREENSSNININETEVANNLFTSTLPTSQPSVVSFENLSSPLKTTSSSTLTSSSSQDSLTTDKATFYGSSTDTKKESEESPTTLVYTSSADISTMSNDGNADTVDDKSSTISTTLGSNVKSSVANTATSSLPTTDQTSKSDISNSSLGGTSILHNSTQSHLENSSTEVQLATDKEELASEMRSTTSVHLENSSTEVQLATDKEELASEMRSTTSVYKMSTDNSALLNDGNTAVLDDNVLDETKSSTILSTFFSLDSFSTLSSAHQTSESNTKSLLATTSTLQVSTSSTLISSTDTDPLTTENEKIVSKVTPTTSVYKSSTVSSAESTDGNTAAFPGNAVDESTAAFAGNAVDESTAAFAGNAVDESTAAFADNALDESNSTILMTSGSTVKHEDSSISTESINELMSMFNTTVPLENINNTTSSVSTAITMTVDAPVTDSMIAAISSHTSEADNENVNTSEAGNENVNGLSESSFEVSTLNSSLVNQTTISITPLPLDTDGSSSTVIASYTTKPQFTIAPSIELSSKYETLSTTSVESAFTTTVHEIIVETATENVVSEIIFSSTFEPSKEMSTLDPSSITTENNADFFTTDVPSFTDENSLTSSSSSSTEKSEFTSVAVENVEQGGVEEGSFSTDASTGIAFSTDASSGIAVTKSTLNVGDVIATSESLSVFTVSDFKMVDESKETSEEPTQQTSKLTSTDFFQVSSPKTESSVEVGTILNTPETVVSVIVTASTTQSTDEHMNHPIPFDLSTLPATPSFIKGEELNQAPFPDDTIHLPVTSTEAQEISNDKEANQSSLPSTEVSTHQNKFIESTQSVTVTEPGYSATQPSPLTASTVIEPGNDAAQPSSLPTTTVTQPGDNAPQTSPLINTTVIELENNATQPSLLTATTVPEPGNNATQHSSLATTTVGEPGNNYSQPSQLTTTEVTEHSNNATQPFLVTTTTVTEPGHKATQTSPWTTTVTEPGNNATQLSPLTSSTVIEPGNITTQPSQLTTTTVTKPGINATQPSPLTTATVTEPENKATQTSPLVITTVTKPGNITAQPSPLTTTTVNEPEIITTQPSPLIITTVTEAGSITAKPSQLTTTTVTEQENITTEPSQLTTTTVTEPENITTQPSPLTAATVTEPRNITTQPSPLIITTVTGAGNITTQPSLLTTTKVSEPENITIEPYQLTSSTDTEPVNKVTQSSQLIATTDTEPGNNATQPSQLTTTTDNEPGNNTTQPSQLTATTVTEPENITTQPSQLTPTTVTNPRNISTQPTQLKTTTVTTPRNKSTQPSQLTTATHLPSTDIADGVSGYVSSTTLAYQPSTETALIENMETEATPLISSTIVPSGPAVTEKSHSTIKNNVSNTSWSPQSEQTTVDVLTLIRNGNASFFDESESTTDVNRLDDLNTNPNFDKTTQFSGKFFDQSTQPFVDDATFISVTTSRVRNLDQECETYRGPDPGRSCVFPFLYHGKIFFKCTYSADINGAWCSTEVDNQYRYIKNRWGYCNDDCPKEKSPCVTTGPYGKKGLPCVFPFHYMHMMFWGCTSLPSPGTGESMPWCPTALDDHLDVLNDNWGYCSRKCLGSGDILIESPLFTDTSAFDQQDGVSSSSISTSLQTEMSTAAVQTSFSTTELPKIKPTETPFGITNVTEIPQVNMNQTELLLVITNVTEIPLVNTNITEMPFVSMNVTEIPLVDMNLTEIPAVTINTPVISTANTTLIGSTTETFSTRNENQTEGVELITVPYETYEKTTKVLENLIVTNRTIQNGTEILVTSTPKSQSSASMTESPGTTFSDETEVPVQVTDFVHSTTSPQLVSTEKVIRICGKADHIPPQDHVLYIPSGCWDPVLELMGK